MQFTSTPIFALLLTSLVSINGSPLPAVINNKLSPLSLKTFNPQHSSHGASSHGPLQIVTRTPEFKLHTPRNSKNSTKKAGSNKHSNHTTKAGSKKITERAAVKLPKLLEKLAKLFSRDTEIELRSTGIQLNSTHSHHNGTKATGHHNTTKSTGHQNSTSKANFKFHSNHTSKAGSKVAKRVAVKLPKILEKIAKLFSRSIDSPNTYPENNLSIRAAVHLPSWLSKLAKFFRRDVSVESTTSAKLNATRAHAHSHKNQTKSVKFGNKFASREVVDLQERERAVRFGGKTATVFNNFRDSKVVKNTRDVPEGDESADEETDVGESSEQQEESLGPVVEGQDDSEESEDYEDSEDSEKADDAPETDEEQTENEAQVQDNADSSE